MKQENFWFRHWKKKTQCKRSRWKLLCQSRHGTTLLSGQFRFFAKITGALLTRVTVVPTQPIKTLNLLRSERTVYAVSNSWMETKQAVLPLSAPVSTSILLCFGNRHNHITVCDETIFVSSMTLYQQAGQVGTNLQFLNRIFQIQIQNACWAVPKPLSICIVPMQAAHLFQTLL